MNEQWIREGFEHYYTVEKMEAEIYEEQVLLSNMIGGILPCEIRRSEEEETYYFHLGSSELYIDQIKSIDARKFFGDLICTIEEAQDYLLNPDYFILTPRHVYVKSGKPALCYVPGYGSDITEQLKEFTQVCVDQLDYGNRHQVTFFYELHSKLRKGHISLGELKEFIDPKPVFNEVPADLPERKEPEICESLVEHRCKKDRRIVYPGLIYIPLLFSIAYFAVRAWNEGMTYPNFRGILMGGILLAVNTVCLYVSIRKKGKEKELQKDTKELPGDDTVLLSDETVLLISDKVPVLKLSGEKCLEIAVRGREFTVGRQQEAVDFCLSQAGVSRRHFQILTEEDSYMIRDLGSKNGTFVNGERVWDEAELKSGDEIKAGTEQFEFMV